MSSFAGYKPYDSSVLEWFYELMLGTNLIRAVLRVVK